jgi:hypothetical protein
MSGANHSCIDIDRLLCDYLDGVLPAAERHAFEAHAAACPACAALVADCGEAVRFMDRCETPEPPRELLTRIIHQLPESARGGSPLRGWRASLRGFFQPVLQPKFAMGMAMTILSFSMLGKFVGPMKPITPADLDPIRIVAAVDDKLHRAWNSAVKYYEGLRVVYEIQSRLREWNEEEGEQERASAPDPATPGTAGGK